MEKHDEEMLYKDLQYTTNAYFAGEQVYPYWESIYALLIGAFLTAYFAAPNLRPVEKLILCLVGIIYSINWWRLVERNRCYANARGGRMRRLSTVLQREVKLDPPILFTADDGMDQEIISSLTTFRLFEDQKKYLDSHST